MTDTNQAVNRLAMLQNVSRCMMALQRVTQRPGHLPGIISLYGPSGWGKSTAATFVYSEYRSYYVEAKDTWSRKTFLQKLLEEMRIKPMKTIADMASQAAQQLADSGRPLLIDEFDYLIKKGQVDMIRDLYDSSGAPILIIGEENLETKLRQHERFHNRVLDWVPAEACDWDDTLKLADLYCTKVDIQDDLLQQIFNACRGNVSRTCINLANVQEFALTHGLSAIGSNEWGDNPIFTGVATRRAV